MRCVTGRNKKAPASQSLGESPGGRRSGAATLAKASGWNSAVQLDTISGERQTYKHRQRLSIGPHSSERKPTDGFHNESTAGLRRLAERQNAQRSRVT